MGRTKRAKGKKRSSAQGKRTTAIGGKGSTRAMGKGIIARQLFKKVDRLTWRKLRRKLTQARKMPTVQPPETVGTSSEEETRSEPEGPPETVGTSSEEETRSEPERPPETVGTSSEEEIDSDTEGSPETAGTSSDETWSPKQLPAMGGRTRRQLNLRLYPEAKKELEEVEKYYTQETNIRRGSAPLKVETWRKIKIHMLSE